MMLSSGIVGLSIGSVLQGLLADRLGRRKVMLWALYGMGLASLLLAAVANSPLQFAGFRLCLGTALGMITPLTISYINEWAPKRTANVYTIWVFQLGFSIGGIMAGFAGAFLAPSLGWQAIYYAGAASILIAVAAQCWLPESAQYLATKRDFDGIRPRPGAAAPGAPASVRGRRVHDRRGPPCCAGQDPAAGALPHQDHRRLAVRRPQPVLRPWPDRLAADPAGAARRSAVVGRDLWRPDHDRGLFGGIGSGWLADATKSRVTAMVVWWFMAALAMLALSHAHGTVMMMVLVAAAGFFVFGGQSVQNNYIAMIYPTEVRSTGVGIAVGINRIGGMLGPVVIGLVKSYNPDPTYTFYVLAAALVLACMSFLLVRTGMGRPGRTGGRTARLAGVAGRTNDFMEMKT
jgi:MFS family permease